MGNASIDLKVSQAASSTVQFASFLRRAAILPIVVVLPIPFAPIMKKTVGNPDDKFPKLLVRNINIQHLHS
jgi:hypothetical protein